MAVKQAITNEHWQCLSSDAMPSGAANGATLHVVDTGACFVFHGGGWVPDLRDARSIKLATTL
jgi:hypothetical protein